MKTVVGIILGIATLIFWIHLAILAVHQTQNCTGHLKRAADANTIDLALKELTVAIDYIEAKGLTEGYTSVFWKTPGEDLGFFYTNLMNCREELIVASWSEDQLMKSNVLMKLRETLIDNGEKGDSLTYPDGMSRYPHNVRYAILWGLFFTTWILYGLWLVIDLE